jgi:hypothetical protein
MAAAPVSKATAPRQINVDLDRLLGDDIPDKVEVIDQEETSQNEE